MVCDVRPRCHWGVEALSFEDWLKLILQSNVVAAVIVGLFGLLTLKLGIAKFASEKWWERKAASYASALDGLHKMYDCARDFREAFEKNQELDEAYVEKIVSDSSAGYAEMRRGENIGSFLMTKRAGMILSQLRRGLDETQQGVPSQKYHDYRMGLLYEAIIAMTVEAKRDLKT
jgi:hypothetical protein